MTSLSTLVLIKPDAFRRNLRDQLVLKILQNVPCSYMSMNCHLENIELDIAHEHYREHEKKEWYEDLCKWLTEGSVEAIILCGEDVIKRMREYLPVLRKKFNAGPRENLVHCSASEEAAHREIQLWSPWMVGCQALSNTVSSTKHASASSSGTTVSSSTTSRDEEAEKDEPDVWSWQVCNDES